MLKNPRDGRSWLPKNPACTWPSERPLEIVFQSNNKMISGSLKSGSPIHQNLSRHKASPILGPAPDRAPSSRLHDWAKSSFPPQNHAGKSWKGAKGTQREEWVAVAEQVPRPQGAVTCTPHGAEGLGSALFAGGSGRGRRR